MKLRTEYFIGSQSTTHWSGVYGNKPIDAADLEQLGEVYGVLRFSTDLEDFAIERFAKVSMQAFEQAYFEDLKDYKSTLERLEESVWKMKSKMDLLLSREPELSDAGVDIEMALLVFKKQYLYALTVGESRVYIVRDNNIVDITDGLADTAKTGFLQSASLEIKQDDRFCVMTSQVTPDIDTLEESLNELHIGKLSLAKDLGSSVLFIAHEGLDWHVEVVEDQNPNEEYETKQEESQDASLDEHTNEDGSVKEDIDELPERDFEHKVIDIAPLKSKNQETIETDSAADMSDDNLDDYDEFEGDNEQDTGVPTVTERVKNIVSQMRERGVQLLATAKQRWADRKNIDDLSEAYNAEENTEHIDNQRDTAKDIQKEREKPDTLIGLLIFRLRSIPVAIRNHFKNNQRTYAHIVNSAVTNVQKGVRYARRQFDTHILGKNLDRRIRTKRNVKRNRYILAAVVVILSFFIYTSLRNAQISRRQNAAREETEITINRLQSDLSNLEQQIGQSQFSNVQNKSVLQNSLVSLQNEIQGTLVSVNTNEDLKNPETFQAELNAMQFTIQEQSDTLLLVSAFEDPSIIADIGGAFSNTNVSDLVYSQGFIFVSDEARDAVYRVATELNSAVEEHITTVESPYILVKNVANEVIVYDTANSSVLGSFDPLEANSLERFDQLTPPSTGQPVDAAIFDGNDALYELRPQNNYIFRRDKSGASYVAGGIPFQPNAGSTWRIDDTFGSAIDIETPFEIYVLVSGIGLRRHVAGGENQLQAETFENLLNEDREAMQQATAMDATNSYVVVGDSANNRLLVFEVQDNPEKTLRFVNQIVYRGNSNVLGDIREIEINGAARELYVLDGSRVLRFGF